MSWKTHFTRTGSDVYGHSIYGPNEPVGNVIYLSSTTGSSGGTGHTPETAVATLAQALALATANNGDVIRACPGHAQTVTGAAGEGITKAGVTLESVGTGRLRAKFTFTTATAASFDITAANVKLKGVVFVNGIDSQTAMVNVSAADVWFDDDCEFVLGDSSTQAVLGILTTAAADRLKVRRNVFHGSVDTGVASAIKLVGGDSILIEDNVILGAFATTGNIANATTPATNLVIRRNSLLNQTADGNNKVIVADSAATGLIVGNQGGIIDSSAPAPVTAAAMFVGGNYFSSAAGVAASVLM